MKSRTCGVSPKVIVSAITGVAVYLITKLGLQLDPVLEQALNVAAMVIAGYLAPPGDVVSETPEVDPAAGDVRPPA